MSHFRRALDFALRWEGGYSNHAIDEGGETYRGISRVHHPGWSGWVVLDSKPHPIARGTIYPELEPFLETFYRTNYWLPLNLGVLTPKLAMVLFDWAVTSWNDGVKALQILVATKADGDIGVKTRLAIEAWCDRAIAREVLARRRLFVATLDDDTFRAGWDNRNDALSTEIERAT